MASFFILAALALRKWRWSALLTLFTLLAFFLVACRHGKSSLVDSESLASLRLLQSPSTQIDHFEFTATIVDPPNPPHVISTRINDQVRLAQFLELIRKAVVLKSNEVPSPHSRPSTFNYYDGEFLLAGGTIVPVCIMGNVLLIGNSETSALKVAPGTSLDALLFSWSNEGK
jgi:hypothetical protein